MGDWPASLDLTANSRAQTFGSKRRSQITDPATILCQGIDAKLPCADLKTPRCTCWECKSLRTLKPTRFIYSLSDV
jgi:hypothetical protein